MLCVDCCLHVAVGCVVLLCDVRCCMCVVCRFMFCLVFAVCSGLCVVCCLLFADCCLLRIDCCLLLAMCCVLLVVCGLLVALCFCSFFLAFIVV